MKKLIFLLTIFLGGTGIYAQETPETISSVFMAMPENLMIGVDAEQKLRLTAHPDSAEITVANTLDDDIVRTAMTDNYIALSTSEAGTLQVMLLPLVNNTNIVGVIHTVCSKACDSRIDFFTTQWQLLAQGDLFPVIDKSLFLHKDVDISSQDYLNAAAVLDMTPVKLTFVPASQEIKAEYDIQEYLNPEDYKLLKPYLIKEPVTFRWDKMSFGR